MGANLFEIPYFRKVENYTNINAILGNRIFVCLERYDTGGPFQCMFHHYEFTEKYSTHG